MRKTSRNLYENKINVASTLKFLISNSLSGNFRFRTKPSPAVQICYEFLVFKELQWMLL